MVACMSTAMVNWDAALARTTKHLKVVESAVRGWQFSHPQWYVVAAVEDFPPRIMIRCLLRVRGNTKRLARATVGVELGDVSTGHVVQAFSPTDSELVEIGDFIATLATTEFTPKRLWYREHPWVNYELRVDYGRYE